MNRLFSSAVVALAGLFTSPVCSAPQPPEAPQPVDTLTARVGTPENKAVTAIFEAWNSTHTRARRPSRPQTDRYRAKKDKSHPSFNMPVRW